MQNTSLSLRTLLTIISLSACLMCVAGAEAPCHWPQFHGPGRDNKSADTGLLKTWPEGGPPRLWETAGIGEGYSTVAIVGGRIYTTGAIDGDCVITALDREGQKLWSYANGAAWDRSYPGTRSTPTLADGKLYHLSGIGNLVCLEAETGALVWSKNILDAFEGRTPTWGLAESPLVTGDRIFCTPGGKDVSMVALDRKTGDTVWTCSGVDDKPGYASPILVEHEGLAQVVTVMQRTVVGVRAADGQLLWTFPHKVYADENITTPLFHEGSVIVSGCVRKGTTRLRLDVDGQTCAVTELWLNKTLDVKQGGIVLHEGRLYGYGEGQSRTAPWVCIDFETGETHFQGAPVTSTYKFKNGCLTYADGMLYLLSDDGHMALVKPLEDGFEVAGRLDLADPGERPTWAHPVVCGGRLYVRYGDKLAAYDVAKEAE